MAIAQKNRKGRSGRDATTTTNQPSKANALILIAAAVYITSLLFTYLSHEIVNGKANALFNFDYDDEHTLKASSLKVTVTPPEATSTKESEYDQIGLKQVEEANEEKIKSLSSPPRIPQRIVMLDTRYESIHDIPSPHQENIQHTIETYFKFWGHDVESRPYTSHYDKMEAMLNSPEVWYLGEKECIKVMKEVNPILLSFYRRVPIGQDKSDICRIAALYLRGGYYFDTDMQIVKPVYVEPHITFMSPWEAYNEQVKGVFNSFIAVAPKHAILQKNIEIFELAYRRAVRFHILGPGSLYLAVRTFASMRDEHTQGIRDGKLLYNNDYEVVTDGNSEKWPIDLSLAEVPLTHTKFPHVPPHENVSDGCCCNYVVYHMYEKEVYFYSRIAGAGKNCVIAHKIPHRIVFVEPKYSSIEEVPAASRQNADMIKSIFVSDWNSKRKFDDHMLEDVVFLLDEQCRKAVQKVEPRLYPYYTSEEIEYEEKSLICRLSYLFDKGGYYFDTNFSLNEAIVVDSKTRLIQPLQTASDYYELNSSFLGVDAKHPFLRIQLDHILNEYNGNGGAGGTITIPLPTTELKKIEDSSRSAVAFEEFRTRTGKGYKLEDWPADFVFL